MDTFEIANKKAQETLGVTADYIIDMIVDENGAISNDYIRPIATFFILDIVEDLIECADHEDWNMDDVRLAFGRAICDKCGIEH